MTSKVEKALMRIYVLNELRSEALSLSIIAMDNEIKFTKFQYTNLCISGSIRSIIRQMIIWAHTEPCPWLKVEIYLNYTNIVEISMDLVQMNQYVLAIFSETHH